MDILTSTLNNLLTNLQTLAPGMQVILAIIALVVLTGLIDIGLSILESFRLGNRYTCAEYRSKNYWIE